MTPSIGTRRDPEWSLAVSSSLVLHLIRGLAAQVVVVGHGIGFFDISQDYSFIQNSAVAVFFVLSGFVIPYSALAKSRRNPTYGFGHFLIDRFARIYMGLVPALLLVSVIDSASRATFGVLYRYADAFTPATFMANLAMLQEFPLAPVFTSFGSARPLWTIAVEWWIYLCFGWLALRHRWRGNRPVLYWIGLGALLIVPAFNWVAGRGSGLSMMWLMGTVIYMLIDRAPRLGGARTAALVLGLTLLAAVRLSQTWTAYDTVYVGLFAVGLYFVLAHTQQASSAVPAWVAASVTFNAEFSYTLYLIHYTILDVLRIWMGPAGWHGVAVGFVLSNFAAIAMYLAFERHYRRLAAVLVQRLKIATEVPSGRR